MPRPIKDGDPMDQMRFLQRRPQIPNHHRVAFLNQYSQQLFRIETKFGRVGHLPIETTESFDQHQFRRRLEPWAQRQQTHA